MGTLLSEYMKLENKGGRMYGLCPFHDEKTPSFTIFDDKRYYCFGCKANGDSIEFAKRKHNLSFVEALKMLAEKYSIPAPELENPQSYSKNRTKTANYFEIVAKAHRFFQSHLAAYQSDKAALRARQYLLSRGFTEEFMEKAEFGLAPMTGNPLLEYLVRQKYSLQDIKLVGLIGQSSKTKRSYDFFRGRVMIPIRDPHGRVIAFGGRTLLDDPRKYLNSSNTVLFQKGFNLFGLDYAKPFINETRSVIIVEGYMDALQLWNNGIHNCVACLGTALTKNQIQLLKPHCSEIILAFDGDNAGRQAAFDTLKHAVDFSQIAFNCLNLEDKQDPDSLVREKGPEAFRQLLESKVSLFDYSLNFLFGHASKLQYPDIVSKQILPWLGNIEDPIRREFLTTQVSQTTGIPRASLIAQAQDRQRENQSPPQLPTSRSAEVPDPQPPQIKMGKLDNFTAEIFGIIFHSGKDQVNRKQILDFLRAHCPIHPLWMNFAAEMLEELSRENGDSPATQSPVYWSGSQHSEILSFIEKMLAMKSAYATPSPQKSLDRLFHQFEIKAIQEKINFLKNRIAIDGSLSPDLIPNYLKEIRDLSKRHDDLAHSTPQ